MSAHARGLAAALAAFAIWGLAPLYFKLLAAAPALEIVAHRIVWSSLLLSLILAIGHGFAALKAVARDARLARLLLLTTLLTGSNWLLFVWAIGEGRVLEASLGYFITPLINVLCGRALLGEHLRPWQTAAVGLAACGVMWRVAHLGSLPWLPLAIATTFALYGLLRKQARIGAIDGLFVETLIALPLALGWLAWLTRSGTGHFGPPMANMLLFASTGIITAIPLWLFTAGARQLPLATLGFCQYLAPSMQFLLAVLVFGEAFDHVALVGFVFIWSALALFSADVLRHGVLPAAAAGQALAPKPAQSPRKN